jgi:lipopolysaccharide export system permease protein
MTNIDRYIFSRLLIITVFALLLLIFIFIIIDFSENSDDFTDLGASMAEIWGEYYLNYIPEMIRLVVPVAVFTACLFVTSQMAERLEISSLYAAGISMYRLIIPYMVFGIIMAVSVSALDAQVIPKSNAKRIAFEKRYIRKKSEKVDKSDIYRQLSPTSTIKVNYFDQNKNIAYRIQLYDIVGDEVVRVIQSGKMVWQDSSRTWLMEGVNDRIFDDSTFTERYEAELDTTLNLFPRDLARSTSDIYQLTYEEAAAYIESIERSGAGGIELPQVQFYGRLVYPFSMVIVIMIGFVIAATKRKGGKGFTVAMGLVISFLYLALMKIIEPFGYSGSISPVLAATLPHFVFLMVGFALLISARK